MLYSSTAGSAWPSPLSPIRHLFYHLKNIFWPAGGRSQNRKNKWTFAGDFALFLRIFTVNFQFLDFLFWECDALIYRVRLEMDQVNPKNLPAAPTVWNGYKTCTNLRYDLKNVNFTCCVLERRRRAKFWRFFFQNRWWPKTPRADPVDK